MSKNPTRQDDEHRLARLVADWIAAHEEKAVAMREHNEVIKKLEEAMGQLSAAIQGGQYQASLPFEESKKPAIALDESDPDLQAVKAANSSGPVPDGKECGNCHHLRSYHQDEDGKDCFCWQPDCDCETFVSPPPTEEAVPDIGDSAACIHCGHPEAVHGQGRKRGCMRADCECKGYVHPDPLGVADVEPEKREAEL